MHANKQLTSENWSLYKSVTNEPIHTFMEKFLLLFHIVVNQSKYREMS